MTFLKIAAAFAVAITLALHLFGCGSNSPSPTPAPTPPPTPPPAPKPYGSKFAFKRQSAQACLDVDNFPSAPRDPPKRMETWECILNENQFYQFADGNGQQQVIWHASWVGYDLCLGLTDEKVEEGTFLQMQVCNSTSTTQGWYYDRHQATLSPIQDKTLCVQPKPLNISNGADIVLSSCRNDGTNASKWELLPTPPTTPPPTPPPAPKPRGARFAFKWQHSSDMCLDVDGHPTAPKVPPKRMETWGCILNENQFYQFADGNGQQQLVWYPTPYVIWQKLCLGLTDDKVQEGTILQMQVCNSMSTAQGWYYDHQQSTFSPIQNKTLCVQPKALNVTNGADIVLSSCRNDGTNAQKWELFTPEPPSPPPTPPPAPKPNVPQFAFKWQQSSDRCLDVDAPSPPPAPPPAPKPYGARFAFKWQNVHDMCLDVDNFPSAPRDPPKRMETWACILNENQFYRFAEGNGQQQVIWHASWVGHDLCLGLTDDKVQEGTILQMQVCNSTSTAQGWYYDHQQATLSPIQNKTLCVQPKALNVTNGADIVLSSCRNDATNAQKWELFTPAPKPNGAQFSFKRHDMAVAAPQFLPMRMQTLKCNFNKNQWYGFRDSNGRQQVIWQDFCLGLTDDKVQEGTILQMQVCNSMSTTQGWYYDRQLATLSPIQDVTFCVQPKDLNTNEGADIVLTSCHNDATNAQKWELFVPGFEDEKQMVV